MNWLKKLRCRLGFHDWRQIGYASVLCPTPVERCRCCGAGRQINAIIGFEDRWTPEQMDEAIKLAQKKHFKN